MEWKDMSYTFYMHTISSDQSIPESAVSPGIALAISAMAFPSSCIRDTTADGDVGTDEGENVGTDDGVAVVGVAVVGIDEGENVGTDEGENVGTDDGENVGTNVGTGVGAAVGATVGANVGTDIEKEDIDLIFIA